MPEEVGKEPGNWELYRGIERVETALKNVLAQTVPLGVYTVEKAAMSARIDDVAADNAELRTKIEQAKTAQAASDKALEDQRGRNRLFVYGLILGPLGVALVGWLLNGGLTP